MNIRLKTAVLALGVVILFGSAVIDTVEKNSERQHSETVTAVSAPAEVIVQPAPVVVATSPVVSEHSS